MTKDSPNLRPEDFIVWPLVGLGGAWLWVNWDSVPDFWIWASAGLVFGLLAYLGWRVKKSEDGKKLIKDLETTRER